MGGQQPVAGSMVTVYALGTGGSDATALATTTTLSDGSFAFNTTPDNSYTCPGVVTDMRTKAKAASPAVHDVLSEPSSSKMTVRSTETNPGRMVHARPSVLPDLTQAYVYLMAAGGDSGGGTNSSILLAAGLGACSDAQNETVEINEVSTVVFANAMQNYSLELFSPTNPPSTDFGTAGASQESIESMDVADTNTIQAFVNLSTGLVNPNVVSTDPQGTSITIEAAKIYSLANILASCVNSADDRTDPGNPQPSQACTNLLNGVHSGSVSNTLDAAVQIASSPYYNVAGLYALAAPKSPFGDGLTSAPNDWTVGISYTTSAMGLGLFPAADGSPTGSNIDIDSNGRIWFPSNKSGATGMGYFDPTELAFTGPIGANVLQQPQYVALYDDFAEAYATDLGSNKILTADAEPGVSSGTYSSFTLSDGYGGVLPSSTGAFFVGGDGSLNVAYNDTVGGHDFVTISSDHSEARAASPFSQAPTGLTLNTTLGADPNDVSDPVAVAATNTGSTACGLEVVGFPDQGPLPAPVSTTTNPCVSGGAATGAIFLDSKGVLLQDELTTATTSDEVCSQYYEGCFGGFKTYPAGIAVKLAYQPRGIAFDGNGNVWLANAGDQSIANFFDSSGGDGSYVSLTDRPYLHDATNGGTMTSPAGIAIDSAGNVWVSNATCTSTTDASCSFTLSEVIGIGYPTITPLSNQVNQEQGTEPGGVGRPVTLKRKSMYGASKSGVFVGK